MAVRFTLEVAVESVEALRPWGAEQTEWSSGHAQLHRRIRQTGGAGGYASRNLHPQEAANAARSSADFTQKSPRKPQTPPDRASYKLYYVNYEIEL